MGFFSRFRKKEECENDLVLKDGKLIPVDKDSCGQPKQEKKPEKKPEPKAQIPPPLQPLPQIKSEPTTLKNPPAASYMPCYITDENQSDYGGFIHYLNYMKISERYRSEQAINLRVWQRGLGGRIDTESIQKVLVNPGRAGQLLTALRNYAKYRDLHGDPRLLLTLARVSLKRQAKNRTKKIEKLNPAQIEMYTTQAEKLCSEGNRSGVFIGLLLQGVSAAEIHGLEMVDGNIILKRKDEKIFIDAPGWLVQAMTVSTNWRRKRTTINREVRNYGTTPREILSSVDMAISNIVAD
ncbi:MAG: hypothetical protein GY862_07710 [Gammaproteobacteria bacterium]|nr:hypothetical protein [Gammaproteobacteria bacterium]